MARGSGEKYLETEGVSDRQNEGEGRGLPLPNSNSKKKMAGWTNSRELVPLMCPNIDAHIAFSFLGIRGAYLFYLS